jgi:HAD superfamily hydrolase (TIGR01490 family)
MPTPVRPLALFDFDGTLLPWDTQKLFCHYVLQRHPSRRWYLPLFAAFLPFAPLLGAEGMKRVFLSFLWGMKQQEVEELARGFASQWVPSTIWPEMLAILQDHKQQGDLTVLISASPEPYIAEIGRILGFDLACGTKMEFPAGGLPLFPDLRNNKGWAKVERLREILHPSYFSGDCLHQAHGYTDSTADLPMLTLCQHATVVNPSSRLRQLAEQKGWRILSLPRPWKNKLHRYWQRLKYVSGC